MYLISNLSKMLHSCTYVYIFCVCVFCHCTCHVCLHTFLTSASNMIMIMSIYSVVKHTFDFNFVKCIYSKTKRIKIDVVRIR